MQSTAGIGLGSAGVSTWHSCTLSSPGIFGPTHIARLASAVGWVEGCEMRGPHGVADCSEGGVECVAAGAVRKIAKTAVTSEANRRAKGAGARRAAADQAGWASRSSWVTVTMTRTGFKTAGDCPNFS